MGPCTVNIRRAQVKVGLINLCKGLLSLNARIYYSIAHRQAVCKLSGGYSTILPHKGVHCSNWFLSDDARWTCLEESMARSLTVISLLLQSTTNCRYRVYTKFLLTYTAIYRKNRKVLPLEITALQPQSHFHLGKPYIFQKISNKMQFYSLFVGYLETALHVSGNLGWSPTWSTNSYLFIYNIFIKIKYMFRVLPC
jgi:hypothetical protein